jgi:restriction system protein
MALPPDDDDDNDEADSEADLPFDVSFLSNLSEGASTAAGLMAQWREHQRRAFQIAASSQANGMNPAVFLSDAELRVSTLAGSVGLTGLAPTVVVSGPPPPEVVIGALVETGGRTDEGDIIVAVAPAWLAVLRELESDSNALVRLDWRQMEELVAGAYREEGWTVTLTSRSNDKGRDVIAYRDDFGGIRLLDQVKAYKPGHIVDAEAVRAMCYVLDEDRKASKAVITTTSIFAPGVYTEFATRTPTRLELRDGAKLRAWLKRIFER